MTSLIRHTGAGLFPAPAPWMHGPSTRWAHAAVRWTIRTSSPVPQESLARSRTWPSTEVVARDDQFTVAIDVPGIDESALDVTLTGRVLVVRGREQRGWVTREFERAIEIPKGYDVEAIDAVLARGVVAIRVPREGGPRSSTNGRLGLFERIKRLFRRTPRPTAPRRVTIEESGHAA